VIELSFLGVTYVTSCEENVISNLISLMLKHPFSQCVRADVQGNNSSSSPLRSDGSWIWWKQLLQQLPTDVQTSIFTSETQPCVRGCFAPKAYSVNRTMFIIQERMVYITMVIFSPLWFLLWN